MQFCQESAAEFDPVAAEKKQVELGQLDEQKYSNAIRISNSDKFKNQRTKKEQQGLKTSSRKKNTCFCKTQDYIERLAPGHLLLQRWPGCLRSLITTHLLVLWNDSGDKIWLDRGYFNST